MSRTFFATATRGTEGALLDELHDIGIRYAKGARMGVHVGSSFDDAMRACLESRVAMRLLMQVADFRALDGDELYDGIRSIDWTEWLGDPVSAPARSIRISCATSNSQLSHSQFVVHRTKDAIVDQQRERGRRPTVDREDADVEVFVRIDQDKVTVHLDLGGNSLAQRGYRSEHGEAPLRENVAAALLQIIGWHKAAHNEELTFLDPMCGAGTIAIEAALISRNIAPGLLRPRFGFERWESHTAALGARVETLREQLRSRVRPVGARIFGSDIDHVAVEMARRNARRAGVEVKLSIANLVELAPMPTPLTIVTNPPYGERMRSDLSMREISTALARFHGARLGVIAEGVSFSMGYSPEVVRRVVNGTLGCTFAIWTVRRPRPVDAEAGSARPTDGAKRPRGPEGRDRGKRAPRPGTRSRGPRPR